MHIKFPEDRFTNNVIYIYITVVFVMRVFYVYYAGWEFPVSDGLSYDSYAKNILLGTQWLTSPEFEGHSRAPGYPLFLSIIYFFVGPENLIGVYVIQSLIGVLISLYIYKIALLIYHKKVALIALLISSFYPYYFHYSGVILREILISFLLVVAVHGLLCYLKKANCGPDSNLNGDENSRGWLGLFAFVFLIHTDPRYLFFIPFVYIIYLLHMGLRDSTIKYIKFLTVVFLLMLPWGLRSYFAYDGFVLINTRTLDMRSHLSQESLDMLTMRREYSIFSEGSSGGCISNKDFPSAAEINDIKKGENIKNRSLKEVDAIVNDRFPTHNVIEKRWYNFKVLWRPYHFVNEYRPWPDCRLDPSYDGNRFGLVKLIYYGALLPFMFLSILWGFVSKDRFVITLFFPILATTLLHVIMWAQGRYRLPVDAFVIILASFSFFQLLRSRFNLGYMKRLFWKNV